MWRSIDLRPVPEPRSGPVRYPARSTRAQLVVNLGILDRFALRSDGTDVSRDVALAETDSYVEALSCGTQRFVC